MAEALLAAAHVRTLLPGSVIVVLVALAATFVATLHGGPQMLYALFFGVACNYLSHEPNTKPGIDLCSRGVLRFGVGLLGARITADQIAGLGWGTALIVVAAVVSTMLVGHLLAKGLGMSRSQGILSGGAVAICGASAALAISAVLPREKDGDRFTLLVVVTVTLLSTLAMVFYPPLARALNLSPQLAGLFLGGTIHDVAQVVGAGYTLSPEAGDYATIVKLFRVALLVWWWWSCRRRSRARASTRRARQSRPMPSSRWCRGFCGCSWPWWPSTRWAGCRRRPSRPWPGLRAPAWSWPSPRWA